MADLMNRKSSCCAPRRNVYHVTTLGTSGLLAIPVSADGKLKNKNDFRPQVREFMTSVRDDNDSNVPDHSLETALYFIVKDLKNQVIASDKAVYVEEEQRERPAQLTSNPAHTLAPTSTPGPASRSENRAAPLSGR